MTTPLMIYGSYGYTGELLTELAVEQGLRPLLAGRRDGALKLQAQTLGLPYRVLSLEDTEALHEALGEVDVVVHCAGPFSQTSQPMVDACLATGTHYLDITGELDVFEAIAARDQEARDAGVMLLPGAGFDVVPTDCLAVYLKNKLPSAESLTLAFRGVGAPSRGTLKTTVENLHRGGVVRRNGELVQLEGGTRTKMVDFGRGPRQTVCIPWGDVSTAFHSTGIPNIEVFMYQPASTIRMMRLIRPFAGVLGTSPVQRFLKAQVQKRPPGPSAEQRASGISVVWGEVRNVDGESVQARLRCAEGYTLTALSALYLAQKALSGEAHVGFQTPAMAYGADLILEFEGSEREDLQAIA